MGERIISLTKGAETIRHPHSKEWSWASGWHHIKKLAQNDQADFSRSPVVKTVLPNAEVWVWSLASELRSCVIHHLIVGTETINILEENIGVNLYDPEFDSGFLDMALKIETKSWKIGLRN